MTTKKALKELISNFVNTAPLYTPLNVDRFIPIFKNHPKYEKKVEGSLYWFVKFNEYRKRSLFIKKENCEEGFSYCEAISPSSPKTSNLTVFRNEIYCQIKRFKDGVADIFLCAICNESHFKSNCHIDHIKPFKNIVESFSSLHNINLNEELTTISNNLCDRELAKIWREYHEQEATLRPTCSTCNMKRGCKDIITRTIPA